MFLKVAFWRRQSGFFWAPIVALFVNIFSPLFISIISTIACIICSSSTFVACICSRFLLRGVEDWTNWNKCSVTYDDTDISPKTNQHMIFLATFSFDNAAAEFFEMLETTSNLAHQNTDFISNYRSFGKLERLVIKHGHTGSLASWISACILMLIRVTILKHRPKSDP